MTPDRRTEVVELFGVNLLLAERYWADAQIVEMYQEKHKDEKDSIVNVLILILQAGLKINFEQCPKWNIVRRLKLRKILSADYLISHLTQNQILELPSKIRRLEDPDFDKKKVTEPETK
jgi:hypothetical protein